MLSSIKKRLSGSIKRRLYFLTGLVGFIMLIMVLVFIWAGNTLTMITAIARFERTHTIARTEANQFLDKYYDHKNPADWNSFIEKWAISQSYNRVFGNLLEMRTTKSKKEFADIVEETFAEADRNTSEILVNRIHLLYWHPLIIEMVDLANRANELGQMVDDHAKTILDSDNVAIKSAALREVEKIEKSFRILENDFGNKSGKLGSEIASIIKLLSIGMLLLSVGLTSLVAFLIIRSISIPIGRFISYSKAIAGGNLNAEIPEISGEELLALSESMALLLSLNQKLKREVDEKTQMALKLFEANKQIVESELKQSTMIANISDVIGIIGIDGMVKYKSSNIEKWFGWQPQDLIGKDALLTVHPDDLERIQKAFDTLREKDNSTQRVEYRYRCKDGCYKPVELTATNLTNNPAVAGILLNYHDITERNLAEKEQLTLQGQLAQAQKMESVGRLAGGVAHDFNNMLGVILGHSEMLIEQVDPNQPIHGGLEEIRTAAKRSADLTRQLLTFARKQTVSPEVFNLNKAVDSILTMLQRLIGENIDLVWLPGGESWLVHIDPSQIDQILANLCVNARDAIGNVGKLTIETGIATFDESYCTDHPGFTPGEFVLLAVSDNGCGMDMETRANIFEPFFTTKELGEGTGLGLSTVYGIVKQNNGFINVYSEPDQGSTFRLYFPRHIGKPIESRENGLPAPDILGHETILLVEDEQSILKMTTMMLEKLGYTVLVANTPDKALSLATEFEHEIQLLLTDVVMPEMNGRDLARNLSTRYPDINILFMSGYTADVIAQHGVLDKDVHYIQKPFSRKDLSVKVREVLDSE